MYSLETSEEIANLICGHENVSFEDLEFRVTSDDLDSAVFFLSNSIFSDFRDMEITAAEEPCEDAAMAIAATAMQIVGRIGRYIKSSPKRSADWKAFTQRTGEVAEVLSLRIYQAASTSPPITMTHFLLMEKVNVETPVGNPLAVQRLGGPASGICAALVNCESLLDNFGERSSDVGKPSSAEDKARAREFLNSLDNFQNYYALRVLEDIYDRAPGLLVSTVRRALHEYSQDWESLTAFYEQVKADARRLNIEAPELQRAARRGLRTSALTDEQIDNLLIVQHVGRIHRGLLLQAGASSSATSLMRSMMSMIWEWTIPNGIADRGGYSDLGTCQGRCSGDNISPDDALDAQGIMPSIAMLATSY
ncbi:hypothetical protein FOZ62_020669, partial [Perkinsus olseni]